MGWVLTSNDGTMFRSWSCRVDRALEEPLRVRDQQHNVGGPDDYGYIQIAVADRAVFQVDQAASDSEALREPVAERRHDAAVGGDVHVPTVGVRVRGRRFQEVRPAHTSACLVVRRRHTFELDDRLSCGYRRANPAPRRCREGQIRIRRQVGTPLDTLDQTAFGTPIARRGRHRENPTSTLSIRASQLEPTNAV